MPNQQAKELAQQILDDFSENSGWAEGSSGSSSALRGDLTAGSITGAGNGSPKTLAYRGYAFTNLRHTWASWLAQTGGDPQRLRQIGGWATLAMVERYSHLNVENLRAAMELLPDARDR